TPRPPAPKWTAVPLVFRHTPSSVFRRPPALAPRRHPRLLLPPASTLHLHVPYQLTLAHRHWVPKRRHSPAWPAAGARGRRSRTHLPPLPAPRAAGTSPSSPSR